MLHELESITLIFLAWALEVNARLYIVLLHNLFLLLQENVWLVFGHLIIDKVRGLFLSVVAQFHFNYFGVSFFVIFFWKYFCFHSLIFSSIYYSYYYYYQVFFKCLSFLYCNNMDISLLLTALKIPAKK